MGGSYRRAGAQRKDGEAAITSVHAFSRSGRRAADPAWPPARPQSQLSPEKGDATSWKRHSTCSRWPSCRGFRPAARASCSRAVRSARRSRRPSDHADLLGSHGVEALRSGAAARAAEAEAQAARRLGIEIVGCDEDRYPQWLRRTLHAAAGALGEGDARARRRRRRRRARRLARGEPARARLCASPGRRARLRGPGGRLRPRARNRLGRAPRGPRRPRPHGGRTGLRARSALPARERGASRRRSRRAGPLVSEFPARHPAPRSPTSPAATA